MEKIRKITIKLVPADVKNEQGLPEFDMTTEIETFDASKPKKEEVIWLLEEVLSMVKDAKIIKQ